MVEKTKPDLKIRTRRENTGKKEITTEEKPGTIEDHQAGDQEERRPPQPEIMETEEKPRPRLKRAARRPKHHENYVADFR